jgi:GH25 family lysozyme M1 (1,4-beta-N-acetylmuramidase)
MKSLKRWKKLCSVGLAAAMTCLSVSVPFATAEEIEEIAEPSAWLPSIVQNEDGEPDYIADAITVLTYYAQTACGIAEPMEEDFFTYYDLNQDGSIEVEDAVCFLTMYARISAGLEAVPPEGWASVTTDISVEEGSETTSTETVTEAVEITETTESTEATFPTTESSTESTTTQTTASTTAQTTASTTTKAATTTTKAATTTATAATTTKKATTTTTTTTTEATTTTSMTTVTTTTMATKTGIGTGALFEGIDVSVYQGAIDWEAAKEDGVEFAIIRAGYGKYASQKDKYFDTNMKNAQAAGLPCGAYWFSYAVTVEDAIKEADAFYEVIKDYQFEYPVSFDMEAEKQTKLTKDEVSAIIDAFCSRMESYGYYVSLYSYASFLNNKVTDDIFEKYDIWVAHYNTTKPSFDKKYGLWQYSSTGKIDGITGNVDLDFVYMDYERIIKNVHLNGF